MEEATLSDLEGVWVHSFGYHIKVVQGKAEFANGLTFDLKPVGKTIEMDGWRISLTKSTSEEIIWQKKGENDLKWTFEEDLHANLEAAGIDQSNIISGKRRRGSVDYIADNAAIEKEERQHRKELEAKRAEEQALAMIARKRQKLQKKEKEKERERERSKARSSGVPASVSVNMSEMKELKVLLDTKDLEPEKIKDVLKKLESVKMTVQVLAKTLIGKALNPYRKHKDSEISRRAKKLFDIWRNVFKATRK